MTRIRKKIRKYKWHNAINCKICGFCVSRLDNLKRHILKKHEDFLKFRARKFNSCVDTEHLNTFDNHVNRLSPWPDNILSEFKESYSKQYFKKKEEKSNEREDTTQSQDKNDHKKSYDSK